MQNQSIEIFRKTLNSFYQDQGKDAPNDVTYLTAAYEHTEALWWENLKRVPTVRYLLIGEAPLYGEKQAYIYNDQTPGTAFLGKPTIAQLLRLQGENGALADKAAMLEAMRQLGLVVLDLFPFAFNAQTQFNYAGLSPQTRATLAEQCGPWHLSPKLEALLQKGPKVLPCGIRYVRLEAFAKQVLQAVAPDPQRLQIELACQRRANAPLDLEQLARHLAS